MNKPLGRVVSWGHELLAEITNPGELAVDLTAGNGFDTLVLARLVGEAGQVVAFDIQSAALENTRQRLLTEGFAPRIHASSRHPLQRLAGIDLVADGHEHVQEYLPGAPQAIVANLGYLPGGDRQLTTRSESTLRALKQSLQQLAVGGRLAVAVYVGHPGGEAEGEAVSRFFAELDERCFQVLQLKIPNRLNAPFLLAAEKTSDNIY